MLKSRQPLHVHCIVDAVPKSRKSVSIKEERECVSFAAQSESAWPITHR